AGTLSFGSTDALGSGNLTLGVVNGNDSYAGLISGTGSLIKVGSGTQTLMATNSFSGGARVNSGTLAIGVAEALGTGNLTLASNNTTLSTLANMTVTNSVVLNGTGVVNTGTNRVNSTGTISGSGSLNKQGTGTLVLSGSNTFSGGSFLNAGTLSFGSTDALGSGNLTFVSNSVLQSTANLNITNRVVINSGVTFDYGNYTMTNSGVISGAGNFLKSGNGALSLTASNTFGGTMQINAGTVDFGSNGSVAPTTVYLGFATNDRGIMRVQNGNTLNISGSAGMVIGVSGAGALYQSGGNINLTGTASAENFVVGRNSGAYGYYQLSGTPPGCWTCSAAAW
ncbi:MAG: hypothetical protein EBU79_14520, partial [Betaproteobacteria bacterium]|nr:hypothetical protein [Betaproteobacteria bacterium]